MKERTLAVQEGRDVLEGVDVTLARSVLALYPLFQVRGVRVF